MKKNYRLKFGEQDIWRKRSWRPYGVYIPSDERIGFDEDQVEVMKAEEAACGSWQRKQAEIKKKRDRLELMLEMKRLKEL